MLEVARQFRRLKRAMRIGLSDITAMQNSKLRCLVRHAYDTVPYYRKLFDEAGVDPVSIMEVSDLARVPVSRKNDLQAAGVEAITSSAFTLSQRVIEKTSGSSGSPFEIHFDRRFVSLRNAMFLRALGAAGYRLGQRMMLVSGTQPRRRRWPTPWLYQPFDDSPQRMVEQLNRFRPQVLYGWVTPLRQLAEHVRNSHAATHKPRAIVTTAEPLDAPTRQLLHQTLGGEVFQIFGLTEMGALAWECAQHDGLHLAQDVIIAECVDQRLLLTNLELYAMPLLRYDCGDRVEALPLAEPCACGCTLARLPRIEGRQVDCLQLVDGRILSPYRVTLALEKVEGLRRYQVVQSEAMLFEVGYVPAGDLSPVETESAICAALRPLLGKQASVAVIRRQSLDPPTGRKFRVVECRCKEQR